MPACSTARLPASAGEGALNAARAQARLTAADRLVRAGCYDCLVAAYREFEALTAVPVVAAAAAAGVVRAAALAAMRERELGMVDTGYLTIARNHGAAVPDAPGRAPQLLDAVAALTGVIYGVNRRLAGDDELDRSIQFSRNRDTYVKALRDAAPFDELGAYAWATYMCRIAAEWRNATLDEIFVASPALADTPLMLFRRATCRGLDERVLETLLQQDPRFGEVPYLLGLIAVGRQDLDGSEALFGRAHDWRPRWPSLLQAMGDVAMTAEDLENAAALYGQASAVEPRSVDARLGKVRALTYLGRHEDAIAATDPLLASNWSLGDARYWRALNEAELQRYDEAWADVEEAGKLLLNSDVPKLAGIIAYRRHELDVARARFEQSRERNPADCEVRFYLGVVRAEQSAWLETADTLMRAGECLEQLERRLRAEIAAIAARPASRPDRRARQIARREREIASAARMLAASWFNIAVAYFNLSQKNEARLFAERVVDDDQFGARAREILARLK